MNITLEARISDGKKLGRKMGYPTANIPVDEDLDCKDGVYAVCATLNGRHYPAIANLGYKPSIEGGNQRGLEVHIFDFDKDIYGEIMQVTLLEFIREETLFPTLDKLTEQIKKDVELVKENFKNNRYVYQQ